MLFVVVIVFHYHYSSLFLFYIFIFILLIIESSPISVFLLNIILYSCCDGGYRSSLSLLIIVFIFIFISIIILNTEQCDECCDAIFFNCINNY